MRLSTVLARVLFCCAFAQAAAGASWEITLDGESSGITDKSRLIVRASDSGSPGADATDLPHPPALPYDSVDQIADTSATLSLLADGPAFRPRLENLGTFNADTSITIPFHVESDAPRDITLSWSGTSDSELAYHHLTLIDPTSATVIDMRQQTQHIVHAPGDQALALQIEIHPGRCPAPDAVPAINASDATTTDAIHITWSPSPLANNYTVIRYNSDSQTSDVIASEVATAEFQDATAERHVTYAYSVIAANTCGVSAESASDDGSLICPAPVRPTGIAASDGSYEDKIVIAWNSATEAKEYHVLRSLEPVAETATEIGVTTETAYTDTDITSYTVCYYWVYSENECSTSSLGLGDSGYSACQIPEAPLNVVASDGIFLTDVLITWDENPYARWYEVYRYDPAQPDVAVFIDNANENYFVYSGTHSDQECTYTVKCSSECGASEFAVPDTGYSECRLPGDVTDLSASDGTLTGSIQLSWAAAIDAQSYEIYRSGDDGITSNLIALAYSLNYLDQEVQPGISYLYSIRAANACGVGDFTEWESGHSICTQAGDSTNLQASDSSSALRIDVAWSAAEFATTYTLFRSTTDSFEEAVILTAVNQPNHSDHTAAPGIAYWYWVQASNACSTGSLAGPEQGIRKNNAADAIGETAEEAEDTLDDLEDDPGNKLYCSQLILYIRNLITYMKTVEHFAPLVAEAESALALLVESCDTDGLDELLDNVAKYKQHIFHVGIDPGYANLRQNDISTFTVSLVNQTSYTTTYNLTLDELPSGITANLSDSSVTLSAWEELVPGTVTIELTTSVSQSMAFPLGVTVTVAEESVVFRKAYTQVRIRDTYLDVASVTVTPNSISAGTTVTATARILNSANISGEIIAVRQVSNGAGQPVQETAYFPVELVQGQMAHDISVGSISTAGFGTGTYVVRVSLENPDGSPVLGFAAEAAIYIGTSITASVSLDQSVLLPGNSEVSAKVVTENKVVLPADPPSPPVFIHDLSTGGYAKFNEHHCTPLNEDLYSIPIGTDISGMTIGNIQFERTGAPLIVTRASSNADSTYTPGTGQEKYHFRGATYHATVISPGGPVLTRTSNHADQNDGMILNFVEPVQEFGCNLHYQKKDGWSAVQARVYDVNNTLLSAVNIPISTATDGPGVTWLGGSNFWAVSSEQANIKKIEFRDLDNTSGYPNFGYDSFRYRSPRKEKADFVFLVDNSFSMAARLTTVTASLADFANDLVTSGIDARFAVATYDHPTPELKPVYLLCDLTPCVSTAINTLQAIPGDGRGYESGIESIRLILNTASGNLVEPFPRYGRTSFAVSFRPDARKNIILITDEDSDLPWFTANRFPNQIPTQSAQGLIEPQPNVWGTDGTNGWQQEVNAVANDLMSKRAYINMFLRNYGVTTQQYGNHTKDAYFGSMENWNRAQTLANLVATGVGVGGSSETLQAQVLTYSDLVARSFDINRMDEQEYVDAFYAAKFRETVEDPLGLSFDIRHNLNASRYTVGEISTDGILSGTQVIFSNLQRFYQERSQDFVCTGTVVNLEPGEVCRLTEQTTVDVSVSRLDTSTVYQKLMFPGLVIAADHIIALDPPNRSVDLGSSVTYSVVLSNYTDSDTTYALDCFGLERLSVLLPGLAFVPAETSVTVPLQIESPFHLPLTAYNFTVVATTLNGGQDMAPGMLTINDGTEAPPEPQQLGVVVDILETTQTLSRGEPQYFRVLVANIGEIPTTFTLTSSGNAELLLAFSEDELFINPGVDNAREVLCMVEPGLGLDAGSYEISVTGTASEDTSVYSSDAAYVSVTEYGVDVDLVPVSVTSGGIIELIVTNNGLVSDTYDLVLNDLFDVGLTLPVNSVELDAGSSVVVTLTESQLPQGYLETAPYTVTAISQTDFLIQDTATGLLYSEGDTEAPVVVINDYTPDPTNETSITLTGQAWDDRDGLLSIEWRVNYGEWQIFGAYDPESGPFVVTASGLVHGENSVEVRAVDVSGNTGYDFEVVTVDLEAPTLVIDEPTSVTWYQAESAPLLWHAVSETDVTSTALVEITIPEGDTTTASCNLGDVMTTEGIFLLSVTATDSAGNDSEVVSTTFGIDRTSPTVTSLAVSDIGITTASISVIASDWPSPQSGLLALEYSLDEQTWQRIPAGYGTTTESRTVELSGLKELEYLVSVRAIDVVGNISAPASISLSLDGEPPVMVIDAPTSFTWFNTSPVTLQWHTESADLASSFGLVQVTSFDDEVTTFVVYDQETVSTEGRYELTVTGIDHALNCGLLMSSFGIDTTDPVLLPDAIPSLTNLTSMDVSGHAHDYNGSGVSHVLIRLNTEEWTTAVLSSAPESGVPTRITFTGSISLTAGSHTIEVRVYDNAGNMLSESRSIDVDLQAPAITITDPDVDEVVADTLSIEATITDDFSGVSSSTVEYRIDQPEEVWQSFPDVSGSDHAAEIDSWLLLDGPTTLYVRAQDVAGNQALASRAFTIDNNYPPQRPTGVSASYISYTEVEVVWNKNTDPDLKHYDLYRQVHDGSAISSLDLRTTGILDTTSDDLNRHIDPIGSSNSPNYWDYALKAADQADNTSDFSRNFTVPPPDAPGGLMAIGRDYVVDLTWNPVSEGFVKGYVVFRQAPGENELTSYTTTYGRLSISVQDDEVTNGGLYKYLVRAFDGAHNLSLASHVVEAVPGVIPTFRSAMLTMFEDQSHNSVNDWDFNDVGAKISAIMELTPEDNVSTIVLEAEGIVGDDTGHNHDLWMAFSGMVGTATYSGTRYPKSGSPSSIGTTLYDPEGSTQAERNIPLFMSTNPGGSPEADGAWVVYTIVLADPESNPLSEFDKVPFDTWLHVISTGFDVHIYDPDTGEYAEDNNLVVNGGALNGVYLNCGLSIPKLDWVPPSGSSYLWATSNYPKFIDFARTYRSKDIKNRDWYEK